MSLATEANHSALDLTCSRHRQRLHFGFPFRQSAAVTKEAWPDQGAVFHEAGSTTIFNVEPFGRRRRGISLFEHVTA